MYGDDEKSDNAKKYMHTTMKEACEIEHIISDQTYECIKKHYKKVK